MGFNSGFKGLNWAILLCDVIPEGKNWVNYAVLTGNSVGLRTVLSSRLSHRELRSHSGNPIASSVYLPTSRWHYLKALGSTNSFSRWASHDIFLFKYNFCLHILHFLFYFSDNIMADVASKQYMTVLFLSTIVTRTRRHTELTKKKKTDKRDGKPMLCQRTFSSVFRAVFFLNS